MEYGGRPYPRATEHLRGFSPEEEVWETPHLQRRLDEIRRIAEQEEYEDFTEIKPDENELVQATQRLAEPGDMQESGDASGDLLRDDDEQTGLDPVAPDEQTGLDPAAPAAETQDSVSLCQKLQLRKFQPSIRCWTSSFKVCRLNLIGSWIRMDVCTTTMVVC